MMKNKYVFTAVMLLCILLVCLGTTTLYVRMSGDNGADEENLLVVTSFYPMYVATDNVVTGIDGIALQNLSEPQTGCLHDFQLTPEDMRLLSRADVFVINGGGIEGFMEDVASAYPDLTIIEACEDITLLESENGHVHEADAHDAEADVVDEHQHDEAENGHEGHSHDEEGNAHAWMSVADYRTQVATIAQGLAAADPAHADAYLANQKQYDDKLAELQQEGEFLAKQLDGMRVILFHEAYAYLAKDLDMDSCYVLNLDEERSVSAGEVADVLEEISENGVTLILAEELYGSDLGRQVEAESNAAVLYLDTLNRGDYETDSYLNGMRENFSRIRDWLQEGE